MRSWSTNMPPSVLSVRRIATTDFLLIDHRLKHRGRPTIAYCWVWRSPTGQVPQSGVCISVSSYAAASTGITLSERISDDAMQEMESLFTPASLSESRMSQLYCLMASRCPYGTTRPAILVLPAKAPASWL
jgi:hypothetical protein